jgi:hypothetical protein
MKTNKSVGAALITGLVTCIVALSLTLSLMPNSAFASGGSGGGGGGGVKVLNFSGNWSGSISTSFGAGAFTMKISQSGGSLSGSVHFGAPIFDSTLKLVGSTSDGIQFSGYVSNGEGSLPITGTLSADGSSMAGTVVQLGETYTYLVFRN